MEDARVRSLIYRAIAAFCALGGLIMIAIAVIGPSTFPERSSLAEESGSVDWIALSDYGLRFTLKDDVRKYGYEKKSGDFKGVQAALSNPEKQPVTLLIDKDPYISADSVVYQVLEVRTRDGMLRTLHDVRRSWSEDYKWAYLIASMLLAGAWFLAYQAGRLVR